MFKFLAIPAAAMTLLLATAPSPVAAAPAGSAAAVADFLADAQQAGQYTLVNGRHARCTRHFDRRFGRRVAHRHTRSGRSLRCRQYNRRPANWRNRGCFAIGPIWVCP